MKRGDVVTVAAPGPYTGGPRPAVVVQSDAFNLTHASLTLCLLSSELRQAPLFRIPVEPGAGTGLTVPSQIMADKLVSVPRERIRSRIGELSGATMQQVDEALRTWLDLGR